MDISNLPPDSIIDISVNLSLEDLRNICSTNRKLHDLICENDDFWRRKYLNDFGKSDLDNIYADWKENYLNSGNVYSFGRNHNSQLGLADTYKDKIYVPTKILNMNKIKQIAIGETHSLMSDIYGDVYSVGSNYRGQLGLENISAVKTPTKIPGISNAQQVAIGLVHSLVLDIHGNVYSFGNNTRDELGLGFRDNDIHDLPTKIPNIKGKKIVAGSYKSAIIDTQNNVHIFGVLKRRGDRNTIDITGKIPNIKEIAFGKAHILLIDLLDDVYSFGSNESGQLGLSDTTDRKIPTKIPNIKAKHVVAGSNYGFIIDLYDNVYSFGSGMYYHLGAEHNGDIVTPTKIENIRAKQISAGENHTLLIDLNNDVYVFGRNDYGQLGLGKNVSRALFPTKIENIKARQVSAGSDSSMILT